MKNLKLKVCGMKYPSNIEGVSLLSPDYMGFIFFQGSKRFVGEIPEALLHNIPSPIKKTGVFVNEDVKSIEKMVLKYGLQAIQLHGQESPWEVEQLRNLIPDESELIKAFGLDEHFDFRRLRDYEALTDFFLFDTLTNSHGGSGRIFDWNLLDRYELTQRYFLSGGIGPEQIEEVKALQDDRLYALDINSRFELEPGLKDLAKLKDFKNKL